MTDIPNELKPVDEMEFLLPSGRSVTIPRTRPAFRPWQGTQAGEDGGKEIVDVEGRPGAVELAVLRSLRMAGWDGVWIDSSRQAYRTECGDAAEMEKLPQPAELLLNRIARSTNARKSAWDVFCWRGEQVLFGKTKRCRREQFRTPELAWLEAALMTGLTQDSFLVIEWDLAQFD